MLERVHLEILAAVKKYGTLTQAASALHLSQSALSHSIKKLEGHIGTAIWQKEGRLLRLTDAGHRVLILSERVLPQFEHTELLLSHVAKGEIGSLRIGMECHPCYQWLLKVITPYLAKWSGVDIDVKQAFQFGGLGALYNYEIDMLVTPDPLFKPELNYIPVFNYEHRLVVSNSHDLAQKAFIEAKDLSEETLFTYPVEPERLDIFSQFLHPAKCTVKKHKLIETTEIMLQMVAAKRGVCALPGWLVDDYTNHLPVTSVQIGEKGIQKDIYLGIRKGEDEVPYLQDFINIAKRTS
ncbi:LysR family transcriptional regulator [Alteromonas sp. 5E99-2]|uniref:LysR family transcriptional regulator n=1 Tax=Alteromonas sp. 5E99-2 TaxID=2817683 RepID=UPI001A990237|nr:LysR family transcriptional regulator [Alteromonas sp. 5E99-2]MBO1255984.1 LysR family transcriptional regulator [Alteromonas sp. 5E99-2]